MEGRKEGRKERRYTRSRATLHDLEKGGADVIMILESTKIGNRVIDKKHMTTNIANWTLGWEKPAKEEGEEEGEVKWVKARERG